MRRETLFTSKAPAAIGPYNQAVHAEGSFLFISGQIPLKADGTLVKGSITEQTNQVLENLMAILKAAYLTPNNIVKTTVYLSSMSLFAEFNEAYGQFFQKEPPARVTVAVAGLPKEVDVEIEAIAVY